LGDAIRADSKDSLRFVVIGALIGLCVLMIFGEAYVRLRPPVDIQEYLGDESSLKAFIDRMPCLARTIV
jgi:hypothetical protein